jgi:hypothetical protein
MMLSNKAMKQYLGSIRTVDTENLENLSFLKLGDGFFFEIEVNENVRTVVDTYEKDPSSDWAGFEYSTNKLHLEDFIKGTIHDVTVAGIFLVTQLADRFRQHFTGVSAVFWLSSDAYSEFPSVTLSFYVEREGMVPLLPKNEIALNEFAHALLIVQ